MSIHKELSKIQQHIKAPKSQFNSFGKYAYRTVEDIQMAAKAHLGDASLVLTDDIIEVGGRIYVKATATYSLGDESISNSAFAREPLSKKGMDESMVTGAASSYARKYALAGLLLLDDEKDADNLPAPKLLSEPQLKKITNLIELAEIDENELCLKVRVDSVDSIEQHRFDGAVKYLEGLIKENEGE